MAPLALLVVGALSLVLYHYVYELHSHTASTQKPQQPVNVNDVIKTTVTVLTLMGAVLAGIYAYRKQLLAEGDAHRADASQLADRYTTAAEQLGHEQAAVRLAGVYALARLADDWEEQRQVCIDVLCAYLRMPYQPDPGDDGHKAGEREVRLTIISVIRDHLRDPDAATAWCTCALDFTGATFDGGDFSKCHFLAEVSFEAAIFSEGTVSFDAAKFGGSRVSFAGAKFGGGAVFFSDALFSGSSVVFSGALFSGGIVVFSGATFSAREVFFASVKFKGSEVFFTSATFSCYAVLFPRTTFSDGEVSFDETTFSGREVWFDDATFSGGEVSFDGATFNDGEVSFDGATFSGTVIDWGPLPPPAEA